MAQSDRASGASGSSGRFFSARALSRYLSSGASTAASTLRSAGASLVSSIANNDNESATCDQVHWAAFDKVECEGSVLRNVLLLAYRTGFQVWDVEHTDDVRQIASRRDGPIYFMQMLKKPIPPKQSEDRFSNVRPLMAVSCDGNSARVSNNSSGKGTDGNNHELGIGNFPTHIHFYSLRIHEYVHTLKFKYAIYSIRCSPRVVAISQASQILCFDAASLENNYSILTCPAIPAISGSGTGYGALALGPRWLAYSGNPVPVPSTGRVSPQLLGLTTSMPLSASNGNKIAVVAKESSKQLAAGIVTLGDAGYKKLSKSFSELMSNSNNYKKGGHLTAKVNGISPGPNSLGEFAGMVIVRDTVSKHVIVQFRAHDSPICALCFDPSGTLLVTASIHGHNINVFRILPPSLKSLSEGGSEGSYVHLYRLQRGITSAVIQDISFSDDTEWIMISSSRGTSHLFAISPYSVAAGSQNSDIHQSNIDLWMDSTAKSSVQWFQNPSFSSLHQKKFSMSGNPVTLSVVSRIRNGNNLLTGAVNGAAALATGAVNPISGAVASTFHNCKGYGPYFDANTHAKYCLLVFSPSGSIIQYALHRSAEKDRGNDFPGSSISYAFKETDTRFVVQALQKWDVCHKRSRRDRGEGADIYGDPDAVENTHLFQTGARRVTPYACSSMKSKPYTEENHNIYISEIELQTHIVEVPLWSKSMINFQIMVGGALEEGIFEELGGESEIEKIPTQNVEAKSKNPIPVYFSHLTTRFQPVRVNAGEITRNGSLQRQNSGFSDTGRHSRRSGSPLPDGISDDTSIPDAPSSITSLSHFPHEATNGGINRPVLSTNEALQREFVNSAGNLSANDLETAYQVETGDHPDDLF